jgi:hypothetical protein
MSLLFSHQNWLPGISAMNSFADSLLLNESGQWLVVSG